LCSKLVLLPIPVFLHTVTKTQNKYLKHRTCKQTFTDFDLHYDYTQIILRKYKHYLCCSKYWAILICPGDPEIVIILSVAPGKASSIWIPAPDSPLILRIRVPPFPMMAPAYYNIKPLIINSNSWIKNFNHFERLKITLNNTYSRSTNLFRNGNLSASLLFEIPIIAIVSTTTTTYGSPSTASSST